MKFTWITLSFFLIFFSLQFFLGEAGIIAFIQKKQNTTALYNNVIKLRKISAYLSKQSHLAKNNNSYLLMNAHRVGLLTDDEYLIKLSTPLFFDSLTYSPGNITLDKKIFFFSNMLLFIASLLIVNSILVFKAIMYYNLRRNEDTGIEEDMEIIEPIIELDEHRDRNINIKELLSL